MGVLDGFKVTFKTMFEDKVTTRYPHEKRPKPERFHGRHVLNRYADGMEKCIGCELCAGVCPARCIYVRGRDNSMDAPVSPGERYGFVYEINYLRCIHCDLCVEACPTEAITESKMFEFSFTNRHDAIYTKAELVVGDDGRPRELPWEDWRPGDDEHTSGWMRATASAGSPVYEDRPLWSAELGYGLREPEGGQALERTEAEAEHARGDAVPGHVAESVIEAVHGTHGGSGGHSASGGDALAGHDAAGHDAAGHDAAGTHDGGASPAGAH